MVTGNASDEMQEVGSGAHAVGVQASRTTGSAAGVCGGAGRRGNGRAIGILSHICIVVWYRCFHIFALLCGIDAFREYKQGYTVLIPLWLWCKSQSWLYFNVGFFNNPPFQTLDSGL